jgi:hypothetical protein
MFRLVLLLAALSLLSGMLIGAQERKPSGHDESLPASLGYADVISEGVAQN